MSHPSHIPAFTSEQAADAVLEAGTIYHRLSQSPCTLEELARSLPQYSLEELERQLRKLVRSGLAKKDGPTYRIATSFFYAYPQGTQMDFLGKLFIPVLLNLAMDSSEGLLLPMYLNLTPEEQEKIFATRVTKLFEELSSLADQADEGSQDRILFVAGTPTFPTELEGLDQALAILRQAAKDRATPHRRSRAILSYFRAPMNSATEANRAILQFERGFESIKTEPSEATFVLMLGFGAVAPQGDIHE